MSDFIVSKKTPNKKDVISRVRNYDEIYEVFDDDVSSEQSSRCMRCDMPFCQYKCPLYNFIPSWLNEVANKNLEEAFTLSNESSPFPEILGKICPHDILCEGSCFLNSQYGSVSIGAIETYISEKGFKKGLKPIFPKTTSNKKVAIIGSGPSGISTATFLLRAGINVEMFEKEDKAGGLLVYGIPNFKLDKKVVERRVKWLLDVGMKLHLNCEVGKDISFSELEKNYDAIFLGIGASRSNIVDIENINVKGVYFAIDFLKQIQKRNFGIVNENFIDVKNKRVVVLGGGDTAMDCLRVAIREEAKNVECLYRRDEQNMQVSKKEYENAKEEGAKFLFNISPLKIITKNDEVTAIELQKTNIVDKNVEIIENSNFIKECDIVILALGFKVEMPLFLKEANIQTNSLGQIELNNYQTTNSKVFAGGDFVRGANLAVNAAADGKNAVKEIIKFLS